MSPPRGETAQEALDTRKVAGEETDRLDHCDECGREMPPTGDSLCLTCAEWDERRRTCIVCGGPKLFLDDATCSQVCEAKYDEWPEP